MVSVAYRETVFGREARLKVQVVPVINVLVRGLCVRPYPNHPRGCPNFFSRKTCPPAAKIFHKVFDLNEPVYAVINEYRLDKHVAKMKKAHPKWTDRQLRCVLYWQGTARKQLKGLVKEALKEHKQYVATFCPEAMGVDITKTLAAAGVQLEWPPVVTVRQVALLGKLRRWRCLGSPVDPCTTDDPCVVCEERRMEK